MGDIPVVEVRARRARLALRVTLIVALALTFVFAAWVEGTSSVWLPACALCFMAGDGVRSAFEGYIAWRIEQLDRIAREEMMRDWSESLRARLERYAQNGRGGDA